MKIKYIPITYTTILSVKERRFGLISEFRINFEFRNYGYLHFKILNILNTNPKFKILN